MEIVYQLFKSEVVEVGDIFWVGIGGFIIQTTRVFAVDGFGFTENCMSYSPICMQFSVWKTAFQSATSNAVIHNYENGKFSIRHDYRANFLNGMLEKRKLNGVERYVSMNVLERVRETISDAVIEG